MTDGGSTLYASLRALGVAYGDLVPVTLSPELIRLLSEQLYRSPNKAIEELVVNAYDADATQTHVYVPTDNSMQQLCVVYDNGSGMSYEGIVDLWKVGRRKERSEPLVVHTDRKQIGKFGIGKLASYAIANRVTYVTHTEGAFLGVTIDFDAFGPRPDATTTEVELEVRAIDNYADLWADTAFRTAAESVGLTQGSLGSESSWTMVILEDLKETGLRQFGRLRHILSTAMPLNIEFELYLNGEEVPSSKATGEYAVEFEVSELPTHRLEALESKTGIAWNVEDNKLVSETFLSGISGQVIVTATSLLGKSADLLRSEGFFIKVRERLVNEEDARFGLHALSHQTFNRFRADIHVDDLDNWLTANRESIGYTTGYRQLQSVLREIFNEARQRYEDWLAEQEDPGNAVEEERSWVAPSLVEHPIADALMAYEHDTVGSLPDESWMYLDISPESDSTAVVKELYDEELPKRPYRFLLAGLGKSHRLVRFDPSIATFTINEDHELTLAYGGDPGTLRLLQDVAAAEALLEVYLREAGVQADTIGEVLEKRDRLLRGLTNAQMFSPVELSRYVRNSKSSSIDLEIAVVAGARALGFVAMHVGGSGKPDGLARFVDYSAGERTITLEAKSSESVPSAKDIDFAALSLHVSETGASGCLLVAPDYAGDDDGNSAASARDLRISCWTVDQFASVVESVESRHLTARQVLDVVHGCFAPTEVKEAVAELLGEPRWGSTELYSAILDAIESVSDVLSDSVRDISMISTPIATRPEFEGIQIKDLRAAVSRLASASKGGMALSDNSILLNVDHDELVRRVGHLANRSAPARRRGGFGKFLDGDDSSSGADNE